MFPHLKYQAMPLLEGYDMCLYGRAFLASGGERLNMHIAQNKANFRDEISPQQPMIEDNCFRIVFLLLS